MEKEGTMSIYDIEVKTIEDSPTRWRRIAEDPPHRQRRESVWLYPAVRRAPGAVRAVSGQRVRGAGVSVRPVRPSRAGRGTGDRALLLLDLPSDLSLICEAQRQRRRRASAFPTSQSGAEGSARGGAHQVELHQIPGRSGRCGAEALWVGGHPGEYWRGAEFAVEVNVAFVARFISYPQQDATASETTPKKKMITAAERSSGL